MRDCDLAFERREVRARVIGSIDSVKNPSGGSIEADGIGEVIIDEQQQPEASCEIRLCVR